jgi:hypothetical protein
VEGAPTEEPRPDASNARRQRPATRATGVSRALACVLKHPWLPTGVLHCPGHRSILCGCIDVPGRQANAVWGGHPTACTIYVKNLGVYWGLVDKISPAFELRNSGVPAVVRSFQLSLSTLRISGSADQLSPRLRWSSRSPRTTDMPLCCSSWAVPSLYLPKTALAALASLCPFPVTVCLPSSPAYTYLTKTAFETLANLQSEDLAL